jgi:hypothetical protein
MLKMKVAPRKLLKTNGKKKCSSVVDENKGVVLFLILLHDSKRVRRYFRDLDMLDLVRNAGERGMGTNSGQPRPPRDLPSCLSRFGRAAGGRAAFHSQEWVCYAALHRQEWRWYGSLWACKHPRVCNRPRRDRSGPSRIRRGAMLFAGNVARASCRQLTGRPTRAQK